jgi:heme oxygenase (biliverdin-producing, ferredoxin)
MQSMPEDAAFPDLGALLRASTRDLHRAVEQAGIMRHMLAGNVDRGRYCQLLRNLHAIYERLEPALERHAAAEPVGRVHLPELARAPALEADLAALQGSDWRRDIPLTAAAAAYVERLGQLDDTDPATLVAHSYVRYLGDLSGGQVLCRIVSDALGLRDGPGTCFYTFGPPGAGALAARYRRGLSSIRLGDAATARVVDEACAAFRRHRALFEELG